jgi:hypothetical protein
VGEQVTIRWLLHPLTAAVALVVMGLAAGQAGGVTLLLVAGAAAGFANSGST